ncbi:MAG: ComEC/Rec2 family competence protein [Vampirovibrionales bacterium]|nr:ComEC/Rec2 family competence protein [Vampirovibrionales bacterium]
MSKAPSFLILTLALTAGWCSGIAVGIYQPAWITSLWPWGFCGVLLIGLSTVWLSRQTWHRWLSIGLLMLLLGGQYAIWRENRDWREHPLVQQGSRQNITVGGIVYPQLKAGGTKHWLYLEGTSAGWVIADVRRRATRARWPLVGSRIELQGNFRLPRRPLLPDPLSGFDEHRYLRSMGAIGVVEGISAKSLKILNSEPTNVMSSLLRVTEHIRQQLSGSFFKVLGPVDGALAASMVLGERAVGIPKATHDAFAQTGLIHLLAASGMNVGIVAGAVLVCFELLQRGLLALMPTSRRFPALFRHIKFFTAMVAVFVYMLLTAMPPSIQRAGVMIILALALKWRHQSLPAVVLLALSVSILLLLTPFAIQSLGLQLSVFTTLGILTFVPTLQTLLNVSKMPWLWRVIWVSLLVPLSAQIWATPLLLPAFHTLPLLSSLLNIPAVWLATPITALGAAFSAFGMVFPLAWQGLIILKPFLAGLLWLAAFGKSQTHTMVMLSAWPWVVTVAWLLLLIAWAIVLSWMGRPVASTGVLGEHQNPSKRWLYILAGLTLVLLTRSLWDDIIKPDRQQFWPLGNRHGVLVTHVNQKVRLGVPASLTYWEARALSDSLKARNIQQIDRLEIWQTTEASSAGFKPKWLQCPIDHPILWSASFPTRLRLIAPTPTRTFWIEQTHPSQHRLLQPGRLYPLAFDSVRIPE